MHATRLLDRPIVTPDMHPDLATNINGPSLIRAPDWLPGRLARYYLYFAHHQGKYIRLALADELAGPWRIHEGGALHLRQTLFNHHIASPDVHVDEERRELLMFFHGCAIPGRRFPWSQQTHLAVSTDGLAFTPVGDVVGPFYWRAFRYGDWWYALAMPGEFWRARELRSPTWEPGPTRFTEHMRHSAVRLAGDTLHVFYSNATDCPECILTCTVDLRADWHDWRPTDPVPLLTPERSWEGGDQPLEPSRRGSIHHAVRQLRDPAIYEEDGRTWLLYSVAGESGIGLAELHG